MAHALRYYKEITHADGKVIRIEFHEKNGTAPAMELGSVIQSLNLEIQGGDDIDTPIIKTQLNFTLVDAPDHAEAKTKKCGAWEEFYSPDATHWKVLVFADSQQIWGGYITPDSYHEVLTYRAGVSFIARDNIGHLNDFPFDATGNAEGMISMYDLVQTAWRKIDSPMQITTNTATWLKCEDVSGVITYMNVSAFKGKNWYEVLESVLYAYGLVMRYVGENKVAVYPLREMPFYGKDSVVVSNVLFERGAERELSPATKRIEESVDYTIEETIARPLVNANEYSGAVVDVTIEGKNVFGETITKTAKANSLTRTFGTGWYNPTQNGTLLLNPKAYNTEKVNDYIASDMVFLLNTKNTEVVYSATIVPQNLIIRLAFGNALEILGAQLAPKWFATLSKLRYAISATQNGITQYWDGGTWVAAKKELSATFEGNEVAIECNARAYTGEVTLELHIYSIGYESKVSSEDATYAALNSLTFVSAESSALLTTNRVNTNYIDTNNVILSREPQLAPAMNTPFVPAVIKNGIFRKDGATYVAAPLWSWNGNGKQQMAVYNHLQLLCYYGKPNNILSGTIVNADVANFTKLYKWNNTEHIITSGVLNLISGYIENATLREFVRYEDMWGDLTDTADFPEVEGSSKTTADSGTQSTQAATYTNTTNVTIGGEGGGTIVLDTFMSDSSTNGVQNRVIKAYVDSSIANLINGAPTTLDTLKEIADAFEQSQDVVEALDLAIGNKADKATTLAGYGITNAYTKEQTYDRTHIDSEFEDVENALAVRALKSEVYTKEDIDGKLTGIATDIDNLEDSKADNTTVNAIDERLKAEEDVTKTYSAWWADLMTYVKVVGGNVVIDTNLLVEGESATRGTGDPSTGGGIDLNALEKYLDEYGYVTEQDVNDSIDALNIGDYAKTSEVERLFTALNIGQYAKTADVNTALGGKVDKVSGKGLSTNDFTTALLNKLNAIDDNAQVNVQSDWNATSGDAFIKNKPTLADVATSGSYNDLSDKPTIPTTMAWTAITDKPTFALVATTGKYSDLFGAPTLAKVAISGKYSDLSGTPTLADVATSGLYTDLTGRPNLGDLAYENSITKSMITEALDYTPFDSANFTKDNITTKIGTTTYAAYNVNGYLPLNGGTIESASANPLKLISPSNTWLMFRNTSGYLGEIGFNNEKVAHCTDASGVAKVIIHSGNIGSYNAGQALSLYQHGTWADPTAALKYNAITMYSGGISAGYKTEYGTSLWVAANSAYTTGSRWRNRLDFGTDGKIYYWNGINSDTLAYIGEIAFKDSNITGNAGSADVIAKTYANENINFTRTESKIRIISGTASNSTDLGFPRQYTSGISVLSNYVGWQMVTFGAVSIPNPYFRLFADDGTRSEWKQIAFLTDNVASATKLQTARTIWGQSFDGTGNVSGDIHLNTSKLYWYNNTTHYAIYCDYTLATGAPNLNYYAYSGHAFYSQGATRMIINSSGNVTIGGSDLAGANYALNVGNLVSIGRYTNPSPHLKIVAVGSNVNYIHMYVDSNNATTGRALVLQNGYGNVGIGCEPQYKLDVNGTCRISGAVTMSSTLTIGGQTTINNNLIVTGDVAVA